MGRPTKRAAGMRKRRLEESNDEREDRLNKSRERNAINISNETEEQRANRLTHIRAYMKSSRLQESPESHTQRLNLLHERLSNETEEQRSHRLGLIHKRLSNETEEQRSHRLNLINERLANETEEQRSRRLSLIHERLSNETEEQRSHRLNLISDRLSNETEEQRSHRLNLISDRLSNETEEQRSQRLSLIHERLSNETRKQRSHRLSLIHERLSNETEEERSHRLGLIHKRLSNETEEERSHRLGLIHERLSNETEEERSHRLGLIHQRLSNETEEKRSHRLGLIHQRLSNETEEQRSHRIGLQQERLSNELAESRAIRLDIMRQASRNRRDISSIHDFEQAINIFADVPCAVCNKALYPPQRCKLNTTMYSALLPEELISLGNIITCSRCQNNIRKRKIPSVAFWNKMTVAAVPEEPANLTKLEERFLCRVVPFLKIMKLQNRFCQDWCRGQVTLFAKDVVEVAEQLPLTPNQVGLVLVVESLENLQRSQEFVVDMNRLYQALTWLMSNNILYRDIRPHFENVIDISEIVQISEERAMNSNELKEIHLTPQNKYVNLCEDVCILHGSFHQADIKFDVQSRGKQCTAIAAVACAAFCTDEPNQWSKSDVDYIVILGDKLYSDSIASRVVPAIGEINPEYLAATDLAQQISYNRIQINILVAETSYNGHLDTDRSTDGFPNLKNGLILFFRGNCCGLLTANSMTVAIYCKAETNTDCTYWLFDSHARGPKGAVAPRRGAACCMKFQNIDKLHGVLRRNLFTPTKKVTQDYFINVYSLTPLIITPQRQTIRSETSENPQLGTQGQLKLVQSESPTFTASTYRSQQIFQANLATEQERSHKGIFRTPQCQSASPTYTIIENSSTSTIFPSSSALEQERLSSQTLPIDTVIETTSMLRSIDESVPNLESVISSNINPTTNNNEMRLAEVTRKIAPPLNVDRDRRTEELAWYCLFPDGKNGFGEARDVQITPLDYFQSRVMSLDKRFNRNDYLFFALSIVEYYRAKSSVSVSCRMRQGQGAQTPQGLIDNMHLTMRNIRGSASYWQKCCSELTAMVRTLGPPTWFMTFSCNDLNWPDMIKALLIADGRNFNEAESLSFLDRLQLVQKHPVVVSRQFTVRVNALMRFLKRDSDCLGGPVVDFWYRIEFQNRGSPHLHMLVWCDNIPDFATPEGIAVIERVVSCSLTPNDCVLQKIVENVQIHKHTATCYKNRNDSHCRFGFPRPANDTTICVGPDEVLSNNGRFCCLKRTVDETMVNNYNPLLLSLWKANIDVQPCGNVTAVAYYVAKYASKCEPHDTGEAIREAVAKAKRQGGPVWNQLFAVSMAILSQRLVSAPECAYRLCHLPLKMCSRKTVFVNSCRPNERFRLIRFESDDTSIYNNIFDRYVLRPIELEDLSLAEFSVKYETVSNAMWNEDNCDEELRDEDVTPARFIRLTNNTRMRIRNKSAVLRTRYYTLNSDKEAYYYSLLVCHIPFRDESDILLEEETAEECFIRRQRELRPLHGNVNAEEFAHAEQTIQQALAQAVALNAARDTHNDDAPLICGGEHIVNCDDNYCEDESERSAMPDEIFLDNIRGLNVQQKDLFHKVSTAVESDLQGQENQLLLFITGGAGSGKSFLLKLFVEHVKRCYAPTVDILLKAKFVEVGSLTGVAARQIFGKTLHSLFSLPIEKGNTMTYKKITGRKLENERRKWRHIHWLVIDEISMVSYENLRIIHLRLQEFKNNNKLFGGVHILLFGDILQLPPVKGHWCFIQPPWLSAEVNLWQQFSFCELTINMRQRNDIDFIQLLNSLRVGELTTAQLEILFERRHVPLLGDFADGVAVRIFPTVRQVDSYNEKITAENAKTNRMYTINAVDESREAATYGRKPPENVVPKDINKCGGFLSSIKLGLESRVMLRRNISVIDGLVNGAMGIVKKIKWPALRRDQLEDGELPESVLVKFDDVTVGLKLKDSEGLVAISPVCTTFQAQRGYGDVERRMLPLILSWAVTVHKLQGTTLDKAVIDVGKKNFAKGQIYVALSRVKSLEGIALSDIDTNKLLSRPHDEKALTEMIRLRNLLC